jgi:hypothetical protein
LQVGDYIGFTVIDRNRLAAAQDAETGAVQEALNQEVGIMKRFLLAGSMLFAVMMVGAFAAHAKTDSTVNERATVQFTETVKLMNVFLRGEYLIVHDEGRMAKGEDCTYLYDRSGKLVVSFHCTPVERPKADHFRVVATRLTADGVSEIKEIQFPGSTEAHLVP